MLNLKWKRFVFVFDDLFFRLVVGDVPANALVGVVGVLVGRPPPVRPASGDGARCEDPLGWARGCPGGKAGSPPPAAMKLRAWGKSQVLKTRTSNATG